MPQLSEDRRKPENPLGCILDPAKTEQPQRTIPGRPLLLFESVAVERVADRMRMSGLKSRALHEIVADPWGHADRCMNVVADRASGGVGAGGYAVHDHNPPDPGVQMPNDAALHPVGQDI